VLWTVVGAVLVSWAFKLLAYVDTFTWIALLQLVLGGVGVSVFAVAWSARDLSSPLVRRTLNVAVVLSIIGFVVWALMQVRSAPGYGTDEIAFDQYAAQLAAHFHNPYLRSMNPSFGLFGVSPNGYTFHLNGTPVTTLSYPALSFLVYVPFVWLGLTTQLGVFVNVVCWAATVVLAYRLLPEALKPLAPVLGSLGVFTGFAVGGVTDVVYLVPLMVAVYRWDTYHALSGWRRYSLPIAMGLALSVKQTPWIILPFLIAAMFIDETERTSARGALRQGLGYLSWALGTFFVINAPFILSAPGAWLNGVLTPLRASIVPAGQGAVALSLYLGLGGGQLRWFSAALALAAAGALIIFVISYPRFKALTVLAPAFIMLFGARSFASYMLMPTLPGLVAMASTTSRLHVRGILDARARRVLTYAALATGGGCVVASALAVATPAPLSVNVSSVRTTGQLATIVQIDAQVRNTSASSVTPSFTVDEGGLVTAFWIRASGPRTLAAGNSAQYVLLAPNFFAQPPITGGFQLVAFASRPASAAVSRPFIANQVHVELLPEAVNRPVAVGSSIRLSAQIVNAINQPVADGGVPVYLGQIVYTQGGLVYGEASINAKPIGQTPVVAYTDAAGRATFSVVGTVASTDPVYFEANLVNSTSFYPFGYSDIVPIRFARTKS
jgi:uncharacterized membrane protein